MKIRNGFIVAAVAISTLLLTYPSAWAGSQQQHRWEGVAIGVGAAILGSALIHHHGIHVYTPARMVHSPRASFRHHPPEIHHRYHGHRKPHYRAFYPHLKRHRQGYGVHPGGLYKERLAPKRSYRHPGKRFPSHGPDHHRHGPGAGNRHENRRS